MMDTLSNTVWQRRGSCIVFDQRSLGPFIADGAVISLRQALAWSKGLPTDPPVSGGTLLVSGLETIVETMAPPDAEDFLRCRIRPVIRQIQDNWTEAGVVFGFTSHPKAFEESLLEEEVLFRRRDRKTVQLSKGLWDGSATVNMKRVVREGDRAEEEVIVGYHVLHIS